jgi:pimeloyl-ACP methyl ester carboxylesterase
MKAWLRIGFLLALFAQGPLSAGEEPQYTYVLVHGFSGGGWDWRTMDEILTADGHTVYRPTLTGLGERVHLSSPEIDLTTHIDDVENLILFENLKDIVIVGHSYGGVVITGVMDRVPARIKHAIFLDALVPAGRQSGLVPGRRRHDALLLARSRSALTAGCAAVAEHLHGARFLQ